MSDNLEVQTEETAEDPTVQPNATDVTPPAEALNTASDTGAIPHARFQAVNEAKNAAEARIAEYEAAETERKAAADAQREADLAKRGEFETLLDERTAKLKAANDRITVLEQRFAGIDATNAERIAKRVEGTPDQFKSLIPKGLTHDALLQWFETNDALLRAKPSAPPMNGGATSTVDVQSIPTVELPEETATYARMLGQDPKKVAAHIRTA